MGLWQSKPARVVPRPPAAPPTWDEKRSAAAPLDPPASSTPTPKPRAREHHRPSRPRDVAPDDAPTSARSYTPTHHAEDRRLRIQAEAIHRTSSDHVVVAAAADSGQGWLRRRVGGWETLARRRRLAGLSAAREEQERAHWRRVSSARGPRPGRVGVGGGAPPSSAPHRGPSAARPSPCATFVEADVTQVELGLLARSTPVSTGLDGVSLVEWTLARRLGAAERGQRLVCRDHVALWTRLTACHDVLRAESRWWLERLPRLAPAAAVGRRTSARLGERADVGAESGRWAARDDGSATAACEAMMHDPEALMRIFRVHGLVPVDTGRELSGGELRELDRRLDECLAEQIRDVRASMRGYLSQLCEETDDQAAEAMRGANVARLEEANTTTTAAAEKFADERVASAMAAIYALLGASIPLSPDPNETVHLGFVRRGSPRGGVDGGVDGCHRRHHYDNDDVLETTPTELARCLSSPSSSHAPWTRLRFEQRGAVDALLASLRSGEAAWCRLELPDSARPLFEYAAPGRGGAQLPLDSARLEEHLELEARRTPRSFASSAETRQGGGGSGVGLMALVTAAGLEEDGAHGGAGTGGEVQTLVLQDARGTMHLSLKAVRAFGTALWVDGRFVAS